MHWYTKEGFPRHNATWAEARDNCYRPSVTEALDIIAKPALTNWKIGEAIKAAISDPYNGSEMHEAYIQRIKSEAQNASRTAMGFGSRIHKLLEQHFKGEKKNEPELLPYVQPLLNRWEDKGVRVIETEKVIVNNVIGFGGTCDGLIQPASKNWVGVIDFKTTKKRDPKLMTSYLEHKLQLAAYGGTLFNGELDNVKLINIFISSTNPGAYKIVMHEDSVRKLWRLFLACYDIWCAVHNYDCLEVDRAQG